jgi:hypothetical protein
MPSPAAAARLGRGLTAPTGDGPITVRLMRDDLEATNCCIPCPLELP